MLNLGHRNHLLNGSRISFYSLFYSHSTDNSDTGSRTIFDQGLVKNLYLILLMIPLLFYWWFSCPDHTSHSSWKV